MWKKFEYKDDPFKLDMAVPLEDFYIVPGEDASHRWFNIVVRDGRTFQPRDIAGGRGFYFIFPTAMPFQLPAFNYLLLQPQHPEIKRLGIIQVALLPGSSTAILVYVEDGVQELNIGKGCDICIALLKWRK